MNRASIIPRVLLLGAIFGAGCGSNDRSTDEGGMPSAPVGPCRAVTERHSVTSAAHVAACEPISYATNPPSGGNHYGAWAAFQTYDLAVPHGFLVHAMEHGAVVFWHRCEDCADEVAQASAFIDTLPEDPTCAGTGALRRAILTPDPSLASEWAASAWGATLRAECFDAEAFGDFYTTNYDNGPEHLCAPGTPFTENPCPP